MSDGEKPVNRFRMSYKEETMLLEVMVDRDTFGREFAIGVNDSWTDTLQEYITRLKATTPDRKSFPTAYRSLRENVAKLLNDFEREDKGAAKQTGSGERKSSRRVRFLLFKAYHNARKSSVCF